MISRARPEQAGEIHDVVVSTISEIYPRYYTREVVEFFIGYHSPERIREDISAGKVYIAEENGRIAGTGTINGDNIERVYVRPEYRGKGIGSALMDYMEGEILKNHEAVVVESSLPAGEFYRKRKYVQVKHMDYPVENGKILCYEVMRKTGEP